MRKITVLPPTPDLLLHMTHSALETTTKQHVYLDSYVVLYIEVQQDVCDISAGFSLVA